MDKPKTQLKPVKRRKPLGTLLPLTSAEIAALSTITPADIEAAKQKIDPGLAALLDAEPMGRKSRRR